MVKMQRTKKIVLIAILCIGILTGIILLIYELFIPRHKTLEQKLYEYTLQPQLSYEVHLKDNDIYDSLIQKEDQIYMMNLLDYIKVNFAAVYTASEAASLDMDYELVASMVGYNSDKDNRTDYWKKDFPLSDTKTLHMDADTLEKQESIKLSLKEYNDFAEKANEVTGINLSSELIISMVGKIKAKTAYGDIVAPFNINMTVPLLGDIITVTKCKLDNSTDKLTKNYKKTIPVNRKLVVLISFGTVLLIVFLILSIKLIHEPTSLDLLRKDITKLLNKFGSRMIALTSSPNKEIDHIYEVHDIKDLILISDDIQKPIYYVLDNNDLVKEFTFYVDEREVSYVYRHSDHFYNKLLEKLDKVRHEIINIENDEGEEPTQEVEKISS